MTGLRRRKGRHRAAQRELAIFAIAYLVYFGVRAATQRDVDTAFDNAAGLIRFERSLGIVWEHDVQALVVGSDVLMDAANAVYMYRFRPDRYYTLRNACMLTGVAGLAVFALFPVAPPRLLDSPLVDIVPLRSPGYRLLLPPSLVNEYAAMPSFHAGWNLLAGIVVFGATRNVAARAFAVVMPAAMAFSVVATANHFVIDVVAGSAIALAALPVLRLWDGRRHPALPRRRRRRLRV